MKTLDEMPDCLTWVELMNKMVENPDLSVIFSVTTLQTYTLLDGEKNEISVRMPHYWNDEKLEIEPVIVDGKEVFGMLKFSTKRLHV